SRLAIQPLEINEEGPFVKSIGDVLMHSSIFREQTFIFIHGYNVSFENAVRRAAQIAYDLDFDGPAFLFSWPSTPTLLAYLADRDEGAVGADHLRQFLKRVVLPSKPGKVHIVAHSMGAMVLLRGLDKVREDPSISALPLGEVITAAPDVDPDLYSQFAQKVTA